MECFGFICFILLTIDRILQKVAMTGFVYKNAPPNIFHSWVEVFYSGSWYRCKEKFY